MLLTCLLNQTFEIVIKKKIKKIKNKIECKISHGSNSSICKRIQALSKIQAVKHIQAFEISKRYTIAPIQCNI